MGIGLSVPFIIRPNKTTETELKIKIGDKQRAQIKTMT